MIWIAFLLCLSVGLGSLAWSYAGAGQGTVALVLLPFGVVWIYAVWRRWIWVSILGIFLTLSLAAYGLWIDLSTGWMVAGALGGLMAWDLADFMRRLRNVSRTEDVAALGRRHLARLTIVAVLGLLLSSIAMLVRLEFTFEWMVLLTLIAFLGISQMIAWLRRGGG
jgi:hypothetical protein